MKIPKLTQMTLVSGVVALTLSGAALADSNISDTGPGSHNDVTITKTNDVTIQNQNDIQVNNTNHQSANSGSANVSGNTSGGGAMGGGASNENTVATTISIGNSQTSTGGGKGGGSGSGSGSSTGGSSNNGSGTTTKTTVGKGGGLLPQTGPNGTVDVSAMRSLYHPKVSFPSETAAIAHTKSLSTALLAIAATLSVLGAIGSAVYSNKRTLKV